MSKISFDNKEDIIINELKIKENKNKIIEISNKEEISSDEREDSGLYIKMKLSSEFSTTTSSENNKSFSQSLSLDQSNISIDIKNVNNVNKNVPSDVYYFLCNENYYKEKHPEGLDYKKKSKNYISKYKFSCINITKIEDLNLDKINDILKDIEPIENSQNDIKIKNNFVFIENSNIIMNNNPKGVNSIPFCPYVNNYNFNSKYFYFYIFFIDVNKNYSIDTNNDKCETKHCLETDENLDIHKSELEKPKKKLIERPGDWYCAYCNNLNFAFRKECNRCRLPKYYW